MRGSQYSIWGVSSLMDTSCGVSYCSKLLRSRLQDARVTHHPVLGKPATRGNERRLAQRRINKIGRAGLRNRHGWEA
jgi:hypothetical protein